MPQGLGRTGGSQQGYALLSAVVFAFVLVIAGFAFYALVFMEVKGAIYRQESSESFLLADGAVERARAKFLEDRSWREGWLGEAAGRGEYDLAVQDTTYGGDGAVRLLATGSVGAGQRRVEVFVDLPPTAFGLTMLIMGDAAVNGDLCLNGDVHVNGDADFGPGDAHLDCGGGYTSGFEILPPPIYTDPDHFPDATYYYVEGAGGSVDTHARIYDENLVDITSTLPDSLENVISWSAGQSTYTFEFKNNVADYFDEQTGLFARAGGDAAVVVNFGEVIMNPPTIRSDVSFQDDATIHATIINTRFTGVTVADRMDEQYWYGGLTTVKKITFEPFQGVALIAADMQKPGGSLVEFGTESYPALAYVTKDVETVNANLNAVGSVIVLGDWESQGGPDFTYDEGFLGNLPGYLLDEWPTPVSGTMTILRWREIAVLDE